VQQYFRRFAKEQKVWKANKDGVFNSLVTIVDFRYSSSKETTEYQLKYEGKVLKDWVEEEELKAANETDTT